MVNTGSVVGLCKLWMSIYVLIIILNLNLISYLCLKWHIQIWQIVKMQVSASILVNTVAYGLGEGKQLRKYVTFEKSFL